MEHRNLADQKLERRSKRYVFGQTIRDPNCTSLRTLEATFESKLDPVCTVKKTGSRISRAFGRGRPAVRGREGPELEIRCDEPQPFLASSAVHSAPNKG